MTPRERDKAVEAIATILATTAPTKTRGELLFYAHIAVSQAEEGQLAPHDQVIARALEADLLNRN